MHTPHRFVAVALVAALTAAACGGSSSGDEQDRADPTSTSAPSPSTTEATTSTTVPASDAAFPDPDWESTEPTEVGLDPAGVEALLDHGDQINSNCMTVVRDGELAAERYWNGTDAGTDQEIFSASKSVTSTLVGIAQELGHLDIDEPASTFITEWQGTDSEDVTIRNLLSNDSGRYYDFQTDYLEMAAAAEDRTAFAIGLGQQHEPGTHWEYNNSAIQTLEAVLERATGQDMEEFAIEHLFEPIGMTSTISRDAAGNPAAFMGVQASCRDLARFGHLFLEQGNWAGEQVVPADWVEEATSPSQDLNTAYGYLWWLNADGGWEQPAVGVRGEGRFWQDVPLDAYAALGLGGQIVLVLPSQDMVVTRAGPWKTDEQVQGQGADVAEIARLAVESVQG